MVVIMPSDADLEFGLTWNPREEAGGDTPTAAAVLDADPLDIAELQVNLRFQNPKENVDRLLPPVPPVSIDLARLRSLGLNEEAYGKALSDMVLGPTDISAFFQEAVAATEGGRFSLHLRLHINAPPQFHALRWESLRDPRSDRPIATQSGVLLSRYLTSPDWRPIPPVAQHDRRALVVVAGPRNIDEYAPNGRPLAPVKVAEEVARAKNALESFRDINVLAEGGATLAGIIEGLEVGVDVLYLVCHGALIGGVPVLYLESADGATDRVDGRRLVERLLSLPRRPAVVMLCSCQSASGGNEVWSVDEGELSALGPRLAAAGVSAVVAMQGNVSMTTAGTFASAFFRGLADHGIVDKAMSTARRAVGDRPDWWVPVLYSRLRSGRTYYKPAFTERADTTWQNLRDQLDSGRFTPVLGPGLAESILGSRQDIARRWVKRWQIPLASHNQGDLAQVAQYLMVQLQGAAGAVRGHLIDYLWEEIGKRSKRAEPGDPFWDLPLNRAKPEDAITEVGRRLRTTDPGDPYRVAAALPVSVYVTTGVTDLLQDALREADPPRDPITMSFPWNSIPDLDWFEDRYEPTIEDLEEPTEERPLVYHLFGRLVRPRSLVLTEQDYFDWLAAWLTRRKDIPPVVSNSLIAKSLMFVGFRLDDWDFRVVFNAVKSFGGRELFKENLHVGVQLSPDSQLIEPEAAQEYFESYFGEDKVSIYWGETRHFFDEFRAQTGLPT
jgi:hypothetical protein